MKKTAATDFKIHELLQERWSPRAFSSQPVEEEKLLSLFEAARWSPSASNSQPWSFLVVRRENQAAHSKLVETLVGFNKTWAPDAPVLVVALARLNPEKPGANKFAFYDLGQAVSQLAVQATSLGLMAHQMAGFDAEKVRQAFDIPAEFEPVTVMALGYYGVLENLPEELRNREVAPATRKPLGEFVFSESWETPLPALQVESGEAVPA